MISITSTNLDELKAFWRKIEGEYTQVEKIHITKDREDYKMVVSKITRGEMSAVLRCVADKIFELDSMVHDRSFSKTLPIVISWEESRMKSAEPESFLAHQD